RAARSESRAASHETPSQEIFFSRSPQKNSREEFSLGPRTTFALWCGAREFHRSLVVVAVGGENNDVWPQRVWWTFASPRQLGRKRSSRRPSSDGRATGWRGPLPM